MHVHPSIHPVRPIPPIPSVPQIRCSRHTHTHARPSLLLATLRPVTRRVRVSGTCGCAYVCVLCMYVCMYVRYNHTPGSYPSPIPPPCVYRHTHAYVGMYVRLYVMCVIPTPTHTHTARDTHTHAERLPHLTSLLHTYPQTHIPGVGALGWGERPLDSVIPIPCIPNLTFPGLPACLPTYLPT
ncbi:hypothetical protein GGS23DRAFT_557716 [Durotheca rogersii]|uniref:uncharacterized protein n=1 Tax=Durotheca rogersii TaxID=419775 RepID=UPI00221F59E2|nr:uncharacterized protein GGS23DRAFT_557716 [Durotheca rogersii]KAI5865109.1 hypothetical protein GGS23DRAFT_557716 [Durotheca rogersii]